MGVLLAGNLAAQTPVRLAQETALLREPGGVTLVSLARGLRLTPGRTSGNFLEVTVTGWLFTASTTPTRRDGFDLMVDAGGGENLRAEPNGAVLGKAAEGALFARLRRSGGWTQVRRTGWIARNAVAERTRSSGQAAARPPAVQARPDSGIASRPSAARNDSAMRGMLKAGSLIQRTPDGETLATVASPSLIVLGDRDREWVRVALEGWVRQSEVQGAVAPIPDITAAMLREQPDRYVGRTVDWRLQFLARQVADELRPEMPLGHAYLLARGPLPETGFVYVMVTKAQADQLQGLKPLDELTATVTVRAARTRYLATPVVELVRVGGGR
ncbi:MAG TPA: hypothetical protein VJ817_08370 [Gemmatimonadales bacterium]|nr:hypothetical protein [Gemmatimonadales bacterium]